jgi:large conductance mechanosensitive channel
MKGFRTFLLRGNLVDLAVAVVIGVAFNAVVTAFVTNIITPLIAAIAGKPNFASLAVHVGTGNFTYGLFLNALISFVIIALVVYFLIVAPVAKLLAVVNRNKAATERACPECLSQIPVGATRCMYCTAVIPPAGATASSQLAVSTRLGGGSPPGSAAA